MDSGKPRALLSVWDKTGIVEFATSLVDLGFELISTGGTARKLKEAGLDVMSVSDVTQHPEIFDGRVKTLHPAIHGTPCSVAKGRRSNWNGRIAIYADCIGCMQSLSVCCCCVCRPAPRQRCIVGNDRHRWPTMVRASAKNHENVIICCNPNDYDSIIDDLKKSEGNPSGVPIERRQALALTAYQHTASYDVAIANTLHGRWNGVPELFDSVEEQSRRYQDTLLASSIKMETLRYGENAHQSAALFVDDDVRGGTYNPRYCTR